MKPCRVLSALLLAFRGPILKLKSAHHNCLVLIAALSCLLPAGGLWAAPCAGFTDVDDANPFCESITWIKNRGITLGCGAGIFCPDASTTRYQMAAFLERMGKRIGPVTLADSNGKVVGPVITFESASGSELKVVHRGEAGSVLLRAAYADGIAAYLIVATFGTWHTDPSCSGQAYVYSDSNPFLETKLSGISVLRGSTILTYSVDRTSPPAPLPITYTGGFGPAYVMFGTCTFSSVPATYTYYPAMVKENLSSTFVGPFHID